MSPRGIPNKKTTRKRIPSGQTEVIKNTDQATPSGGNEIQMSDNTQPVSNVPSSVTNTPANATNTPAVATQQEPLTKPVRRKGRKKLAGRDKLKFPSIPGYELRVVNDIEEGARIKAMEELDWEVVRKGEIDNVTAGEAGVPSKLGSVVRIPVGGNMKGVLMKKRTEWYKDDKAEEQADIDATMRGLSQKEVKAKDADNVTGQYGGVTITNN